MLLLVPWKGLMILLGSELHVHMVLAQPGYLHFRSWTAGFQHAFACSDVS